MTVRNFNILIGAELTFKNWSLVSGKPYSSERVSWGFSVFIIQSEMRPLLGGTIQWALLFHCVFPWLTRNAWSEISNDFLLTGDCELASSLPDSEEGGKWMSRILPREQRWLDVRGWFFGGLKSGTTDVFLIYDTQCLALKWNCPEEIWKLEFLFLFWIKNVCSIIYFILTGDRV